MLILKFNDHERRRIKKAGSSIRSIYASNKGEHSTNIQNGSKRKVIKRITLHISNDCNLRCKYCFGGGGSYNQERNLMTEQTAIEFVDFCVEQFERVEKIVFFGGEPMLNLKGMEIVCNRFKYYKEEGKIDILPNFVIITNGTILTDRMLAFIKRNISAMTISIDGPKEINDIQRIYKNGKGSYERIAHFIHTIQEKTNVKYSTKQPIRSYILIIIIVMKIFQNLWIRLLELKV